MLVWARKTASLTQEEAAVALDIPLERLQAVTGLDPNLDPAPAVRCRNSLRRSFTALPLWSSQCPRFKLGPVPPSSFSHPIPHVLAEREVMR